MKYGLMLGRSYDIVDVDNFYHNRDLYKDAGVALNIPDGKTSVSLPYMERGTKMDKPGVYDAGCIDIIKYPTEQEREEYSPEIIDFDNVKDIEEFRQKSEALRTIDKEVLTTTGSDSQFIPPLLETDTPEMRAVKEAIIAKNIDLDKYADRYGTNYPNDKRRYKDDKITLTLIKRACQCLDMRAQLILEDVNPDVPNPIGKRIIADLTSGFNTDDNE